MVDENFKIGLSLELEEASLESIVRQVQRRINDLFKQPGTRAAGSAVPGGPATIRSAGQAISVDAKEIGSAVRKAIAQETSGFTQASKEVVKAVNALTRAIERQGGPPGGGGRVPDSGAPVGDRGRSSNDISRLVSRLRDRVSLGRTFAARQTRETGSVDPKLLKQLEIEQKKLERAINLREKKTKRLNQASQELERSEQELIAANKALAKRRQKQAQGAAPIGGGSAFEAIKGGVREKLTERQVGRSNVQRAANVDASRRGGAPATAGGSGTGRAVLADTPRRQDLRKGDTTDRPITQKDAQKKVQARSSAAEPIQNKITGQVSQSIKELRAMVAKQAPAGVSVNEQLLESVGLGLKTIAQIGPGAAASIEGLGANAKHVHATLVITGKKLESFSNTVSDAASAILNDSDRWQRVNRAGRRDPQAFTAHVRGMTRQLAENLPKVEADKPLAPFAKGGEVKVLIKLDAEQKKRINSLDQEADRQAELNRILFEATSGSTELSKALKALGIDMLTTAGLSEDIAGKRANFREIREVSDTGRPGPVSAIETVMQSRDLAGIGPGGRGAVKAQRMAQAFRLSELESGTIPSVTSPSEQELYKQGALRPGAFQETKAALFDPSVLAETFEDQFVFDPGVFKPVMKESSSVLVKSLKEGVNIGATFLKDQVVGSITNALTGEEEAVTPNFKAAEGKVKEIEKVWIDGVEAVKVVFESLNDAVTGMKLTERGGSEGIARAEPGMAKKLGLPEDVGLAVSSRAVGARANVRTMAEMISNNISDATGVAASEISEKIFSAMKAGGANFYEAGMKVAKELGLVEIPGVHDITEGPLRGQRVVTGKLAVGRLPDHGEKGTMDISERFLSGPNIQALKGRGDNAKFADQAVEDLRKLTSEFYELDKTLAVLTGEADAIESELRTVFPEELRRLPQQAAHNLEELKNTLADPAFSEPFKLMLPTREGGERALRVPAVGNRAGERDIFKNALGGIGTGKLTRMFDQIIEQATAARVAMGQISIEKGSEQIKEASEITSKKLRDLATEVGRGAKESEEGAAAAQAFVAKFRPLVESLGEGPAGLKYKAGGREREIRRSATDYLDFLDEKKTKPRSLESQVYAVSDVLGERAATGGSKAQLGAVHKDVDILNKAMLLLGVTLDSNSEAAEKAMSRLEQLEETLVDMLATRALSANKPSEDVGRSAAQSREAGVLRGPIGTIINFAVDSQDALHALGERLLALRDAGVDVNEALTAVESNLELQETGFLKIGRDELLINRKDFEKWAADMAKTKNISVGEARKRLTEQPVATGRYPITGARSIVPKKLRVVGDDVLPQGHLGVGGITPTVDQDSMDAIQQAASEMRESIKSSMYDTSAALEGLTRSGRGTSEEADQLKSSLAVMRADLSKLNGEISSIAPVFEGVGQNADFDGDKMFAAGLAAEKATTQINTLADEVAAGAASFRGAWAQVVGTEVSKGGMGDFSQIEKYFGRVAKGRVSGVEGGRLQPVGSELVGKETHALVAGKKSVGLLDDMFNRMLVSVQTGTGEMSDAMETGLGAMMLGINESLAQKHGSGGTTGPGQFLSALRKGKLDDIKSGLGSGEGFLGKLSSQWKEVQEEMRNRLYALDFDELKEFAKSNNLSDAFEETFQNAGGNLLAVADTLVDELDIFEITKQMFEQMKENAKAALMSLGHSESKAEARIQAQLTPDARGKIVGLDQEQIVLHRAPGYAATRGKAQEGIAEMEPMEKARLARTMLNRPGRAETPGIDLETGDASDSLKTVLDNFRSFMKTIAPEFRSVSTEEMSRYGANVRGFHKPAPGGEPGEVGIREDIVRRGVEAYAALRKALNDQTYAATLSKKEIDDHARALEGLIGTGAHEFLHKESKVFKTSVRGVSDALSTAGGTFHESGRAVQNFINNTSNVKKAFDKLAGMEQELREGRGDPLQVEKQRAEAQRRLSEEMLGHRLGAPTKLESRMTTRRGEKDSEVGDLSAINQILDREIDKIEQHRPEVFKHARDALSAIRSGAIEGAIAGVQGSGPEGARAAVTQKIEGNLQFAGRGRFTQGLEVLEQQERAIAGGRASHRLSPAQLTPGGLEFGELPQIPAGMEGDSKIQEYWKEYTSLLKDLQENGGEMDPDALKQQRAEMSRVAGQVQQRMRSLKKTPKFKDLDLDPFQEMQRMQREWSATQMQVMTKRARELQGQINEMQKSGQVDTPEFAGLIREFEKQVELIHAEMLESLQPRGRSHQTVSPLASAKGVILPEAVGLGLEMRPESLDAAAAVAAGPGAEGEDFLKRNATMVKSLVEMVKEGSTATQVWSRVFEHLSQFPEHMQADLHKIQQFLGDAARIVGYKKGQFSEASKHLQEVSKWAKRTRDSLEGVDTSSFDKVQEVLTTGSKQQRTALARAMGGGDTQKSLKLQMEGMQAAIEERRRMLKELVETGQLDAMGASGRAFEGMQFEIIDPKSGQVIQKFSTQFAKFGKDVKVSMSQAGAATQRFGNQMRNSLRRVVQWGLASGIVYGTVRALRNLVGVMSDVETRVTNLKKVMDLATTNFEFMQDSAVDMGKSFGIATEEVLDGMVVYAQQGLKMNEIMDRTKATMMAVNVTTLNTTEATEALTAAMKLFGSTVDNSGRFVDMWGSVAAKHAITAKDLALATQRSGAAAKTAGVEYQDFLGIVTAIGSVTRQSGKEIATGTKFMFRAMRRPTAQKELMGLGVQSQTGAGELRPAMDVLGELAGKWQDMSKAQQLNTAQAMAGIRHYNQFVVLMENFGEVLDASADATNSQGFAARRNAVAMQTFTKEVHVLREQVKGVVLDAGKLLLPTMKLAVQSAQQLVSVLEGIPDTMKQAGVAGAAGLAAFGKAGDFVVDTWDLLGGRKFEKTADGGLKQQGILDRVGGAKDSLTGFGRTLKNVWMGGEIAEDAGAASKAIQGMVKSFKAMGTAARVATLAAAGGLAIVAGLVGWWILNAPKTGKKLEEGLAPGIAASMDQADALDTAKSKVQSLAVEAKRAASIVAQGTDPSALKIAADEGSFKDPLLALRNLRDSQADFAQHMARTMPGMVSGMNELGEFTMITSDAFHALSTNAADFAKAAAFHQQIEAMAGYNKELATSINLADRVREKLNQFARGSAKVMSSLGIEMPESLVSGDLDAFGADTLLEKYENINKTIKNLSTARAAGQDVEAEWAAAVSKQLELRDQVLSRLKETKRILEEMPVFESMDMAANQLGPDLANQIRPAVEAGLFGRGATVSSVMMKQLGKTAGFGGLLDYESAATAGGTLGTLVSKGVNVQGNELGNLDDMEKATGDLVITSQAAAIALLKVTGAMGAIDPTSTNEAITAAQQLTYDAEKGIYRFFNVARDTFTEVSAESFQEIALTLSDEGKKLAFVSKKSMEEAMESTRRILTLQFTGAMAGIRTPANVDIGPARFSEVSANQRMMGTLVEEMQELSDIQNNITQKAKEFNEEMSAEGLSEGSKQIQAMGSDMLKVIMDLQQRGFKLSVIAHYTEAMHALNKTLENSAEAARRLMIEQNAAFEASMHFSGALKGLQVMPALEFGKSTRELSGLERAQLDNPEIGGAVAQASALQARAKQQQQNQVEAIMKVEDIKKMIKDLESRGDVLTQEQQEKRAALLGSGMSAETAEIVASIVDASVTEKDLAEESISIQMDLLSSIKNVDSTLVDQTKLLLQIAKLNADMEEAKASGDESKISKVKTEKQNFWNDTMRRVTIGDIEEMWKGGGANVASMREKAISQTLGVTVQKAPLDSEQVREWKKTGSPLALELEGDAKKDFEDFRKAWLEAQNEVEQAAKSLIEARQHGSMMGELRDAENKMGKAASRKKELEDEFQGQLLRDKKIRSFYTETSKDIMTDAVANENKIETGKGGKTKVDNKGLERKMAVYRGALQSAIDRANDAMSQTTDAFNQAALEVTEPWRIVDAVGNFANSIEQQIDSFKKAEMLHYDKLDSDLEGPFARVGKPGFKTDFEKRREEIQSRRFGGLRSLDQMRADAAERDAIDFDEKEARIKQSQDKEVAALRQQQSQAESLRSVMSDALLGGDLKGTGLEGSTKEFMNTLTDQLATSEQADMRGGDLFFKGVPALEDASRFLRKIKELQEKKAQEAIIKTQQIAQQPVVDKLAELIEIGREQLTVTKQSGDAAEIGTTAQTARGMPGVGVTTSTGTRAAGTAVSAAQAAGAAPLGRDIVGRGFSGVPLGGIEGYGLQLTGAQLQAKSRIEDPKTGLNLGKALGTFGGTAYYGRTGMFDPEKDSQGKNFKDMKPEDLFVKEQVIESRRPSMEGPTTTAENFKTLRALEAKSPATKSFQPSGLYAAADAYNQEAPTLSFGDDTRPLGRQTGISNMNQVRERWAALQGGNDSLTTGAVATDSKTGLSSGAPNAQRLEREQSAGGGTAEIADVIGEKISTLVESLSALTEGGLRLPDNFTSEIGSLGNAFTEALSQTLAVSVEGPVETANSDVIAALGAGVAVTFADTPAVTVDGLDAAFASAISSSDLGSGFENVVTAVSELGGQLETALAGQLQVNIAGQSSDLTFSTDALVAALGNAVDASAIGSSVADAITSTLEGLSGEIASAIAGEELTVSVNNENLSVAISNVEDIQSALASAIDSSGLGSVGAAAADNALRLQVIESIIDVEGGRPVDEQIRLQIQTDTQSLQTSIDAVTTEVSRLDNQIRDQILGGTNGLSVIRGKAESALSIAQDALNQARRV